MRNVYKVLQNSKKFDAEIKRTKKEDRGKKDEKMTKISVNVYILIFSKIVSSALRVSFPCL